MYHSVEMKRHPFNLKYPADFFTTKQVWQANLYVYELPESYVEEEYSDDSELAAIPFSRDFQNETLANLEAVLFLSREPLSGRRLAQLAELPEGMKIRSLIRELNNRYDHRQSAFRVIEVAGGFQLRTRPEFASWLVRIQEVPVTVRLSSPVMETLAIIAYRQPILRADIEKIRGVQCGELIRQLLDQDFVKIVGRSEELGRPFFYGTTKNFLQVFGLGSLNDLPDKELFPTEIKNETSPQMTQTPQMTPINADYL
ncbi:MAG: SMC-Scp complex subunit ScpB [Planctomycetaceae bacterium]|jgi:segregation and condensation protein B|nr:SMC-Scp complex subunit ScpB [Planctomycetaceae bacterium]